MSYLPLGRCGFVGRGIIGSPFSFLGGGGVGLTGSGLSLLIFLNVKYDFAQ